MILASIPSPSRGVIHLGPLPIRGYALMIILGVIACVALSERRWTARGGAPGTVGDIAIWAVPAGLIGARIYHVVTDPELYFGHGRDWVRAFEIWHGGLGIWGGIALGTAVGAVVARHRGISALAMADAIAPGLAVAQAIGRWGNWFNQELYGRATSLPWGLRIDAAHRPSTGSIYATTFHPTFLYESIWDLGVAVLVVWAERRFRLGSGRAFALYVAAYTAGRAWVEALRVDPVNHYGGLRLNDWVSIGVFSASVAYVVLRGRRDRRAGTMVEA
jgi:prolipoprotein diacylglyceryl transferase